MWHSLREGATDVELHTAEPARENGTAPRESLRVIDPCHPCVRAGRGGKIAARGILC